MARSRQVVTKASKLNPFVSMALEQYGAKTALVIPAASIETAAWVRMRCQYGCVGYGNRLTCPPFAPTPEYTQKVIDGYKTALLFEGGMQSVTTNVVAMEREIFLAGYYKAWGMGGGPCMRCDRCSLKRCNEPLKARPSMEACGVDVYKTLKNNGIELKVCHDFSCVDRHFGVVLVE